MAGGPEQTDPLALNAECRIKLEVTEMFLQINVEDHDGVVCSIR